MKSFLIIGAGTFGHHLCKKLAQNKCEIMLVDKNPDAMEDILHLVVSAKIADCTNPSVLESFGVQNYDVCFVCIGSVFQDSLEITSHLKELGAPKVISFANRDIQAKFLLRNGADQVVYPERDMAEKIAISESSDSIFDCLPLTEDYAIYEISILDEWAGKSIRQLNFRVNYNLAILAIKHEGDTFTMPTADYVLDKNEHIMVMGLKDDLRKILKLS